MSRIRIIMLSLLAVFTISAVASGSASASSCVRVAVAHTGGFENNTCGTPVGTTNEFVDASSMGVSIAGDEYCAKVEPGETSTYSDNKCTTPNTGTGEYTKVLLDWELNGAPVEAGAKVNTTGEGTKQKLRSPLMGLEIECAKVVYGKVTRGTIEDAGKGTSGDIKYSGCVVLKPSGVECRVKSKGSDRLGELEIANLNTELVEGTGGALADKFSPKVGARVMTLEFGKKENATHEAEEKCNSATPLTFEFTGAIVGAVGNPTQSITFTNPRQKGSTLTAFGFEAVFEYTFKVTAETGGTISGA